MRAAQHKGTKTLKKGNDLCLRVFVLKLISLQEGVGHAGLRDDHKIKFTIVGGSSMLGL